MGHGYLATMSKFGLNETLCAKLALVEIFFPFRDNLHSEIKDKNGLMAKNGFLFYAASVA